jgi:hypothetical protein
MSWSRTCVVTLVVCALSTVACSGSTPETAPLLAASPTSSPPSTGPSPTPTRTSSPSPSPTGPSPHSYVTVDDIHWPRWVAPSARPTGEASSDWIPIRVVSTRQPDASGSSLTYLWDAVIACCTCKTAGSQLRRRP